MRDDGERSEHGIIFKREMVLAILGDRKTQTRRIMDPQPTGVAGKVWPAEDRWMWICNRAQSAVDMKEARCLSPYGFKGDCLWVRETWRGYDLDGGRFRVEYAADGTHKIIDTDAFEVYPKILKRAARSYPKFMPSIFLPRAASRVGLGIEDVRVQQVQEITAEDAIAEGVQKRARSAAFPWHVYAKEDFERLWDSINGKRPGCAWAVNPWVWAITFKRAA